MNGLPPDDTNESPQTGRDSAPRSRRRDLVEGFSSWFADLDAKGAVEVLGGTVLFVVFWYQAGPGQMAHWATGMVPSTLAPWFAHLFSFLAGLVLLLVFPALWWRLGRHQDLSDLGLGLGNARFGLKAAAMAAVFITPLLYLNAGSAAFQGTYPLVRAAGDSVWAFLLWEGIYLVYYVAWEGFFRGFWLIGLSKRMGLASALLLQTAVSTVAHFHRPEPETLAALIAGLGFGWLALRSKSIWYVVLLHWYIGAATDFFCLLRAP